MHNGIPMDFLKGKTVLVTGGTGSFGAQFVELLLASSEARKVIVFSRDEFKQHHMRERIKDPTDRLRFLLGDVRDLSRLERAFAGVDIVVHAAALKQVPALEFDPLEAVKTNILGTQNVIDAALNQNVGKVLLVSTDKAVNPINLYGASKLCAEKLLIAANSYRRTTDSPPCFSVVRYGNVVDSRGSIVEMIREQKKTGVITLTDPRMTRFWITLPEASNLVLYALATMRGGEIFVPKLLAAKVTDLIKVTAPKCKVKIIGIRPGEKLHEALLTEDEVRRTKSDEGYFIVEPIHAWWNGEHIRKLPSLKADVTYASNFVETLSSRALSKFV